MLTSPGAWLAAFCVLGAVLLLTGWRRAGTLSVMVSAVGFAAIVLLPIDQWLLLPLENRFPPLPRDTAIERVVVLGGSIDAALSADRDNVSLNGAAARITTLIALAKAYPQARMVFTGGPMPNRPDGPLEADLVSRLLTALGLPAGRVILESHATTTWENAVLTRELVHPAVGETWVLVTSAAHMPRSVGTFRAAGWTVLADPVGYKSFADPAHRGTRGFGERLELIDTAAHEWLGLLYYRLRGRNSAWFPAPDR